MGIFKDIQSFPFSFLTRIPLDHFANARAACTMKRLTVWRADNLMTHLREWQMTVCAGHAQASECRPSPGSRLNIAVAAVWVLPASKSSTRFVALRKWQSSIVTESDSGVKSKHFGWKHWLGVDKNRFSRGSSCSIYTEVCTQDCSAPHLKKKEVTQKLIFTIRYAFKTP